MDYLAPKSATANRVATYGELGGGVSLTEIEVDFGMTPISSESFTITDALVSGTNKILVFTSSNTATDRVGNDWEFEMPFMSAVAGTGNFLLSFVFPHLVVGKRKILYQII